MAKEEIAGKVGHVGNHDLVINGTQSSFERDTMYKMLADKTHAEIFKTDKDAVKK